MSAHRWHILGAGAIGCLIADALHSAGSTPALILRGGFKGSALRVVVERDDVTGAFDVPAGGADDAGSISHLLVTTKAYDVYDAVASIAHRVDPGGAVLLLANGMGFAEQVAAKWPGLDLYIGTTTEGAYRLGPQHIRHAGRGETRIGHAGPAGTIDQPPWFTGFADALNGSVWDTRIDEALWMKLAVNCVINPLTALNGCRNGELASRRDLAALVGPLCAETAEVCRTAGFGGVADNLGRTVDAVIEGTAGNRSSMLQDMEAGRRTEIDYINGYLLNVAERHGVDAPRNRELLEEIQRRGR